MYISFTPETNIAKNITRVFGKDLGVMFNCSPYIFAWSSGLSRFLKSGTAIERQRRSRLVRGGGGGRRGGKLRGGTFPLS